MRKKLKKFEVTATHPITFLFRVEAESKAEAKRMVMDNEILDAEQIDEGERTIDDCQQVEKFDYKNDK